MDDRRSFFGKAWVGLLGIGQTQATPLLAEDVYKLAAAVEQDAQRVTLCFLDPRGIRLPAGAMLERCYTHSLFEDGKEAVTVSASFVWKGDDPRRMMDALTARLVQGGPGCRALRALVGHAYGNTYYVDYAFTLSAFPEHE